MPSAKKSNKQRDQTITQHENLSFRPPWPKFDPLGPRDDLQLHTVVPDQVLTISHFWTVSLCKKYVNFLSSLPLVTTPGTPKKGNAVRVNDRFQIDDPAFAEMLWSDTGLKELVFGAIGPSNEAANVPTPYKADNIWGGQPVGLNPNIRIYRYRQGQFFDQHFIPALGVNMTHTRLADDESNLLTHPGPPSIPSRTSWTLLLYLTSSSTGCIGGETVFYPDEDSFGFGQRRAKNANPVGPVVIGLETGMALLHRHGNDCMLHESREVTQGEKWLIRSDLCVER